MILKIRIKLAYWLYRLAERVTPELPTHEPPHLPIIINEDQEWSQESGVRKGYES
jgi:hypothetical protein